MERFNIDENRIFATGCSNGGMFIFEIATDARLAGRLAGVAPQVGLPHYGWNFGPVDKANSNTVYDISFLGLWGGRDGTVPPQEGPSSTGCTLDCRTSESNGWFYASSQCTVNKWASVLGLTDHNSNYDDGHKQTDCQLYSSSEKNVDVVGCIFNGGQ